MAIPRLPSAAEITWYPRRERRRASMSRLDSLSSTTRILGMHGLPLRDPAGGGRERRWRSRMAGQPDGERRPLAQLALRAQRAAHHLAELAADRQSQARPAVFPRGGCIGLHERAVQPVQLLRAHADTGVRHPELHPVRAFAPGAPGLQTDQTVFGELAGVAQQVEQYLTHASLVAQHGAQRFGARHFQPVAIIFQQRADGAYGVVNQRQHVEALNRQLHLSRFDLRKIEDIVDQAQQMLAGPPDFAEIRQQVLMPAIVGHLLQHLAITDDRIQRRAELMAHVRQEGALGAVGFLGCVFGADQFPLHALQFSHILGQPDVAFQHARPVAHFGRREQHGDQTAGLGAIGSLDSSRPRAVERTYRTKTGRLIPVLFSSAEMRDGSGMLEGYVWLAQDMTELKRVQGELVRAKDAAEEANCAKSAFLANMSHELRTPLNAVIGYSEMLQEVAGDRGHQDLLPDLGKIRWAGKHLLGLINDVLDLSKIEAGKVELSVESLDVLPLIDDAVGAIRPLLENNGNRLEVACAEPLGAMLGDQTRVRQVLFNLLSNACKFTENGVIRLEAKRTRRKGSDWVEFRVTDTGIGMSAEQLDRLYRPFMQADASTTRKYGGTGLGLSISREFCQMMGGSLSAESELGKGSAFTVRLPGHPAAPAALAATTGGIAERQPVHA